MVNKWIEHVKKYAQEHNIPYGCAISQAKDSYKAAKEALIKPKTEKEKKLDEIREMINSSLTPDEKKMLKKHMKNMAKLKETK